MKMRNDMLELYKIEIKKYMISNRLKKNTQIKNALEIDDNYMYRKDFKLARYMNSIRREIIEGIYD